MGNLRVWLALAGLGFFAVVWTAAQAPPHELRSLRPEEVLSRLDLDRPELEAIKEAVEGDEPKTALAALLAYYRARYPLPEGKTSVSPEELKAADQITRHIFQWGPYEPADYGEDIDWAWDPRGDIEWVAAVYRSYWARDLVKAYRTTRDERYAEAFVGLTADWIAKHPLEERERIHPVYTNWKGFAWLDIQTGIRATNLCEAFPVMVHAKAFTPEFLAVLLASLYDHQVKTELYPMGKVHNKAIFEQRGFVNVAYTFPEFRDSHRWMELALERARDNLLAQTTTDGIQREWSGGYHAGVLRDAVEIMDRMDSFGITVPDDYRDRVRKMYDYLFAMAAPDLGFAMFGDTSRPYPIPARREEMQLYVTLVNASTVLDDPKYAARARLEGEHLPAQTSYAFPEAGMYFLRDAWGPEQVYMAVHCSPPAISGHDQPDNGTFELYAFGRWLMPDTGYYTYGHDPEARAWHRQTRVHNTLTFDGADSKVAGELLLWKSEPTYDVLCVQNNGYEDLAHRRTIWFVNRRFFVILDEAVGTAGGTIDLHYQFAPGEVAVDAARHTARTMYEGANVMLWMQPDAPVTLEAEQGWFAWKYGHREPRAAVRFRHTDPAPAHFLTVMVPFVGNDAPDVNVDGVDVSSPGTGRVAAHVQTLGNTWELTRDLDTGEASCRSQ